MNGRCLLRVWSLLLHIDRLHGLKQTFLMLQGRSFQLPLLAPTLPDGDRLRETISAYTWLSSIGRWLFESKLGKEIFYSSTKVD